jgi:hypothetical protein
MSKINSQGVFQGPGRNFQNSRSFPGIPGAVQTLQLVLLLAAVATKTSLTTG